jgi:pyruvate kinase
MEITIPTELRRIRHTKIVCTIGPRTSGLEILREMVLAGMNVARLNFSHGKHEDHAKVVANIRAIAKELGRPIAIIADLQGPKIRVGELAGERQLTTGDLLTILTRDLPAAGDVAPDELPVKLEALARSVSCSPTARSACWSRTCT